jgi:hypothetical protein
MSLIAIPVNLAVIIVDDTGEDRAIATRSVTMSISPVNQMRLAFGDNLEVDLSAADIVVHVDSFPNLITVSVVDGTMHEADKVVADHPVDLESHIETYRNAGFDIEMMAESPFHP